MVTASNGKLEIVHELSVSRAEAFTWWSQADKLRQWSGCAEATHCEVDMDFRVGGAFKQTMEIAGKGAFTFHGIYDEIVEPERICWRAFFGPVTTTVTVHFIALQDRTRIVLTQTGFPDEQSLKTIRQGTEESLTALEGIVSKGAAATALHSTKGAIQ